MEELLPSLALFKPEVALTIGLLLVVLVDSAGATWRKSRSVTIPMSLPSSTTGTARMSRRRNNSTTRCKESFGATVTGSTDMQSPTV